MLAKLSKQLLDDISSALSSHSGTLPRKELHALLESALTRLNLVTREQFDAQTAVLQRTREKVDALENEVAALQELINQAPQA